MYKSIYLKKGKEESLNRFHPWIFSGAIHHMDDNIEEGEFVYCGWTLSNWVDCYTCIDVFKGGNQL